MVGKPRPSLGRGLLGPAPPGFVITPTTSIADHPGSQRAVGQVGFPNHRIQDGRDYEQHRSHIREDP